MSTVTDTLRRDLERLKAQVAELSAEVDGKQGAITVAASSLLGRPGSTSGPPVDFTPPNRFLVPVSRTGAIEWSNDIQGELIVTFLQVGANQVVGARNTGWTASTGTADKTAFATYAAATVGATYNATVQGQINTALAHLQVLSRQVKALKDALIAHGLIGA